MSLHKKYKALIIDVDGTLIENKMDAVPSAAVSDAVKKASQLIHVGIATQRPLYYTRSILEHLKLSGPSVIAGGAQVIDSETLEILHEEPIDRKDLLKVIKIVKEFQKKNDFKFYIQDSMEGGDREWTGDYIPQKPIEAAAYSMESALADELKDELEKISNLSVHKVISWEEGKFGVAMTNALATKQHGIFEVAEILGISTKEIIGVGDSYNDFPLLMACGLKVAMGNAVEDIKAIADYVAPPVENDGVADVIERFVL